MNRRRIYFRLAVIMLVIFCLIKSPLFINVASILHSWDSAPLLLIRRPYLQNVFADSATIVWKTTNAGTSGYVILREKGCNSSVRVDAKVERQRVNTMMYASFGGLEEGIHYLYEVYSNNQLMVNDEDCYFISAKGEVDDFSFFAMGDIGQPYESGGFTHITANQINSLSIKPDFGIGLGDIVYPHGGSEDADRVFFDPMSIVLINTPFYPVMGNHDHESNPDENFKQEWILPGNENYYSFNYGNTHFIGLDSGFEWKFYNREVQVEWLINDLENAQCKYKWIIVYLHHNGKSCSYKISEVGVEGLYPIFARYNVDLVLNGHAHTYERLKPMNDTGQPIERFISNLEVYNKMPDGFISVTVGSGGKLASSYSKGKECEGNFVAKSQHIGCFAQIHVKNQRLLFRAISSESGEIIDRFLLLD